MIRAREDVIEHMRQEEAVDYLFFWGHRPPKTGVSKSCLSQWYESSFVVDGVTYLTAEHCMMAGKARLFGDEDTLAKILAAKTPNAAKKLGRKVQGFDNEQWIKHRFDIVVSASIEKFRQNEALGNFLAETGDRTLVEASPTDRIWGIGLAVDHEHARDPNQWKGLNLLGFALMEAREQLFF